jgi:hypothetical protein
MKKVLLTTTAIVGLTAPAFAADPTAVSDQPYFHHSHPMTWSGSASIALTNLSQKDADDATAKGTKKNAMFAQITAGTFALTSGEEAAVESVLTDNGSAGAAVGAAQSLAHANASTLLNTAATNLTAHASFSIAAMSAGDGSAVEDLIDDYFGGSFSEAMDVIVEVYQNGTTPDASGVADVNDDLVAFQAAQDAGAEGVETTASINTSASLGVSMSAGDGWTASTSGSISLSGGSVSGGTIAVSNGMMTVSVGKTAHAASSAVTAFHGMDVGLDKNAGDTQLQATMALGGATLQVDNEMDGDNLETKNQTVGIKGSYGTMSYGLGWQADGDLGFTLGTNLGGVGLTITRVNAGSNYSMGLGAKVDLGGGMTLSASNAQNSDGLTDKAFRYAGLSIAANGTTVAYSAAADSIGTVLQVNAVHKSISTVGLSYAGGGTTFGITYYEKAGTSSSGDNMIASGSMAISPSITLTGSYNKDDALTTIGASGPLGSAGSITALMASSGSSSLTASFKF